MLFFPAILIGAAFGWYRAARRGGSRFDRIQYALVHAIFFAILALFATIFYHRMT
ncbi:MAG: hypothetical protein KDE00_13210 [Rhodobacteraceae bacterium]|nr:hypothetical protein [Paracoccaceae bacterium]